MKYESSSLLASSSVKRTAMSSGSSSCRVCTHWLYGERAICPFNTRKVAAIATYREISLFVQLVGMSFITVHFRMRILSQEWVF